MRPPEKRRERKARPRRAPRGSPRTKPAYPAATRPRRSSKRRAVGRGKGAGTRGGGVEARGDAVSVDLSGGRERSKKNMTSTPHPGRRGADDAGARRSEVGKGRTASVTRSTSVARRDRWCDVAMACGARVRVGARNPFKKRRANEIPANSREFIRSENLQSLWRASLSAADTADEPHSPGDVWSAERPRVSAGGSSVRD
jgi:hypothetical protein